MGYATVYHVEALDKGRGPFTASTKPTATEVMLYLDQTAAELDATLDRAGYDIPIASAATQARQLVGYWNALGANCLVQRAAQQSVKDTDACAMYQAALTAIADGTVNLPGVDPGTAALARTAFSSEASALFDMGQAATYAF